MDLTAMIKQIELTKWHKQEVKGELQEKYAKILQLEQELQEEKERTEALLSEAERKELISLHKQTMREKLSEKIPLFLSIQEVSAILKKTEREVQVRCEAGMYDAILSNDIWYIKTENFRKNHETWQRFINGYMRM